MFRRKCAIGGSRVVELASTRGFFPACLTYSHSEAHGLPRLLLGVEGTKQDDESEKRIALLILARILTCRIGPALRLQNLKIRQSAVLGQSGGLPFGSGGITSRTQASMYIYLQPAPFFVALVLPVSIVNDLHDRDRRVPEEG